MSDPAQAAPAGPTTREKMDAKLAEGKVKMAEGKVKATELMDKGVAMVPKPWDIKMTKVCCEEPALCMFSCFCAPCQSYRQRRRLLAFTGEEYSCFAWDSLPRRESCCWKANKPPKRVLPEVWPPVPGQEPAVMQGFNAKLALESCFCLGYSLSATRSLVANKFNVMSYSCRMCSCRCCDESPYCMWLWIARHLADAMLIGCMFSQQEFEMRKAEKKRATDMGPGPKDVEMGVMPSAGNGSQI